ncbi:hypothetical protein JB92DRAFT_3136103 [Gautieria morchelliformis]|nr:hypothetical protein JB92DRAFT_3136103 [Gautieria morchelliformis]
MLRMLWNQQLKSSDSAPVVEPITVSPDLPQPSATVQPVGTKWRPMFLLSDDEGEDAPTLKKARKELGPSQPVSEPAWSPSLEIVTVEPTPASHRKGHVTAQVAEADKVPQSVVKQGYPEHAYLLGWKIYIRMFAELTKVPAIAQAGDQQAGGVGDVSVIARPVYRRRVLVPYLEYEAKEERDGREAEAKEWGTKGKAKGKVKDKGSTVGTLSISSKGILGKLLLLSL